MGDLAGHRCAFTCCACGGIALLHMWRGDRPSPFQVCEFCSDQGLWVEDDGDRAVLLDRNNHVEEVLKEERKP